jgi:hypothetical protein
MLEGVSPIVIASLFLSCAILARRLSVLPLPEPLPLKRRIRSDMTEASAQQSPPKSKQRRIDGGRREEEDALELVTQRLPSLLRRQVPSKLVVIDDVDVWLVALERLERVAGLSLLPHPVLVLASGLILVPTSSLDPLDLSLSESTAAIRKPEVLLLLRTFTIGRVRRRRGEVPGRLKERERAGKTST